MMMSHPSIAAEEDEDAGENTIEARILQLLLQVVGVVEGEYPEVNQLGVMENAILDYKLYYCHLLSS